MCGQIKSCAYELVKTVPPHDTQSPEFLGKISVSGSIPALVDEGFCVWESAAIMTYLCDKYGWSDLYPTDLQARTEVNQWLHWHHRGTREVQLAYNMPVMRPDLVAKGLWTEASIISADRALSTLDRELGAREFLAGKHMTLADIQVYQDVGQCQTQYMDTVDFSPYPNIRRWMKDMEAAPEFNYLDAMLHKICAFFKKTKSKEIKSSL